MLGILPRFTYHAHLHVLPQRFALDVKYQDPIKSDDITSAGLTLLLHGHKGHNGITEGRFHCLQICHVAEEQLQ